MLYNFLKTSKKAFGVVFSVFVIFMLTSCENSFGHNSEGTENQNGKTYLSINVTKSGKERTITPTAIELSDLQNFSLKGTAEGESTPALNKSYNTYQDISENSELEIAPGKWTFILSAEYSGSSDNPLPSSIEYLATVTTTIQNGKSNPVYFVLTPQVSGNGELEITFTKVNTSRKFDKIRATLTTITGSAVEIKEDFSIPETDNPNDGSITYSKSDLEPGTYHLLFEFLINKEQNNYQPAVNQWESYVYITPGVKTSATISLEKGFNKVYTIRYEDETGQEISDFSGFAIKKYSARSSFELPKGKQAGKVFIGWKKYNSDGTYEYITKITNELNEDLVLVADITDPILYISGTGDDPSGDGTQANPFESIDKACEKIIALGDDDLDWIIYIEGDVTGPYRDNLNNGETPRKAGERRYTRDYYISTIPSSLTSEHAKSILLIGYNGIGENGIPKDKLNRGLREISGASGSPTGATLSVQTEVPVTIKNLLLTNGYNSTTNPNTNNDTTYNIGGGLYIGNGATVHLTDGVVITHNTATYGGGVYNAGTLYIYGTASIGEPTRSVPASGYDEGNSSNYGSSGGGGIYNTGNLYLGYSSIDTPAEWTGSIIYNFSPTGGAIYNKKDANVLMNNGTLKFNTHGNSGAGGGAVYNYGSFTMTGGTIERNQSNGKHGAGFFNADDNTSGTGIFNFSGGTIKGNKANWVYGTACSGGGVYNAGIMYMYGNAVIGDSSATTAATSSDDCSNYASCYGGGICVSGNNAKLYMGYKSYTSDTENEPVELTGGIYNNYIEHTTSNGGGGLAVTSNGTVIMNSGTIAHNGAFKNGTGVYIGSNNMTIGGSAVITDELWQYSSYTLNIADSLNHLADGALTITPTSDEGKTKYYDNQPVIKLTDTATANGITLADVIPKFYITPLVTTSNGQTSHWIIDETTGKMKIKNSASTSATLDIGSDDIVVYRNGYGFTPPIVESATSTSTICLDVKKVGGQSYSSSTMSLVWTFDGETLVRGSMPEAVSFRYTSADNQIDIDSGKLSKGTYDVCVEATYNGEHYSFTTQIIKN